MVDSSCPTENRQQRTDAADAVPESSKEERDTLNEAARAWNIECLQYEIRKIIFPASIKKAMETQAEAESRKREEILQSEGDQQSKNNLARGK